MASETRAYKGDVYEIFDLCLDAITKLNWEIATFDHTNGTIEANTDVSLLSWGENVEIEIQPMNDTINVGINSESCAQLIDWGVNNENIQKFYLILESLISINNE